MPNPTQPNPTAPQRSETAPSPGPQDARTPNSPLPAISRQEIAAVVQEHAASGASTKALVLELAKLSLPEAIRCIPLLKLSPAEFLEILCDPEIARRNPTFMQRLAAEATTLLQHAHGSEKERLTALTQLVSEGKDVRHSPNESSATHRPPLSRAVDALRKLFAPLLWKRQVTTRNPEAGELSPQVQALLVRYLRACEQHHHVAPWVKLFDRSPSFTPTERTQLLARRTLPREELKDTAAKYGVNIEDPAHARMLKETAYTGSVVVTGEMKRLAAEDTRRAIDDALLKSGYDPRAFEIRTDPTTQTVSIAPRDPHGERLERPQVVASLVARSESGRIWFDRDGKPLHPGVPLEFEGVVDGEPLLRTPVQYQVIYQKAHRLFHGARELQIRDPNSDYIDIGFSPSGELIIRDDSGFEYQGRYYPQSSRAGVFDRLAYCSHQNGGDTVFLGDKAVGTYAKIETWTEIGGQLCYVGKKQDGSFEFVYGEKRETFSSCKNPVVKNVHGEPALVIEPVDGSQLKLYYRGKWHDLPSDVSFGQVDTSSDDCGFIGIFRGQPVIADLKKLWIEGAQNPWRFHVRCGRFLAVFLHPMKEHAIIAILDLARDGAQVDFPIERGVTTFLSLKDKKFAWIGGEQRKAEKLLFPNGKEFISDEPRGIEIEERIIAGRSFLVLLGSFRDETGKSYSGTWLCDGDGIGLTDLEEPLRRRGLDTTDLSISSADAKAKDTVILSTKGSYDRYFIHLSISQSQPDPTLGPEVEKLLAQLQAIEFPTLERLMPFRSALLGDPSSSARESVEQSSWVTKMLSRVLARDRDAMPEIPAQSSAPYAGDVRALVSWMAPHAKRQAAVRNRPPEKGAHNEGSPFSVHVSGIKGRDLRSDPGRVVLSCKTLPTGSLLLTDRFFDLRTGEPARGESSFPPSIFGGSEHTITALIGEYREPASLAVPSNCALSGEVTDQSGTKLSYRRDADGRIIVTPLPETREISYTVQAPSRQLPKNAGISDQEYKSFLKSHASVIGESAKHLSQLPPHAQHFIASIATKPPLERAKEIFKYVRRNGHYDRDNGEFEVEKDGTSLAQRFQMMQSRALSLRLQPTAEDNAPSANAEYAGACIDFAWLCCAMLRSSGVAAEVAGGFFIEDGEAKMNCDEHSWVRIPWPDPDSGGGRYIDLDPTPSQSGSGEALDGVFGEDLADESLVVAVDLPAGNANEAIAQLPPSQIVDLIAQANRTQSDDRKAALSAVLNAYYSYKETPSEEELTRSFADKASEALSPITSQLHGRAQPPQSLQDQIREFAELNNLFNKKSELSGLKLTKKLIELSKNALTEEEYLGALAAIELLRRQSSGR